MSTLTYVKENENRRKITQMGANERVWRRGRRRGTDGYRRVYKNSDEAMLR